jgi:hypothetical protein
MTIQEINADILAVYPEIDKKILKRISTVLSAKIQARLKAMDERVKLALGAEKRASEKLKDEKKGLSPEQRMQELSDVLDEKLLSREITASEIRELKDIFNLKAKAQDILIEMADYREIDPESFDIVKCVQELIDRHNATTDHQA